MRSAKRRPDSSQFIKVGISEPPVRRVAPPCAVMASKSRRRFPRKCRSMIDTIDGGYLTFSAITAKSKG
jgi:hypothetical protein